MPTRKILVAKKLAYATNGSGSTASSPELLAPGALGIYNENKTLITTSNKATALADQKKIFFAIGTVDGPIISAPVERRNVFNYKVMEYTAPVKQVTTITPTLLSPDSSKDEYAVKIIDTTPGTSPEDKYNYSAYGEFADVDALVTALKNVINADPNAIVVASGTSTLILTAKEFQSHFQVALSLGLEGDSLVYTTSYKAGSGDYAHIKALEDELASQRGEWNKVHMTSQYGQIPRLAEQGVNYDLYSINYLFTDNAKTFHGVKPARDFELLVAIPDITNADSGAYTVQTAFESICLTAFQLDGSSGSESAADTAVDA